MRQVNSLEYKVGDQRVSLAVHVGGGMITLTIPPEGLTPWAAEELAALLKDAATIASDEQDGIDACVVLESDPICGAV